jgi:hypothetical protein
MYDICTRHILSLARGFAPLLVLCACSESDPALEAELQEGGSGGTAASQAPECATAFGPTDPTLLIDDVEDGNGSLRQIGTRGDALWEQPSHPRHRAGLHRVGRGAHCRFPL